MGPKGIPGIMLGYKMRAGGRWSGEYTVAPLANFRGASPMEWHTRVREQHVREMYFDPSKV